MSAAEAEAQASAATPIKQRREVKAERRKIWDESESERILEAVKACGWREGLQRGEWRPDWTMISSIVKTRNAKQCRERWENFADPDIDNTPLSPAEEKLLLRMVEIHGPKWTVIAKELPQWSGRRPAQNLKNNWNRLAEKQKKSNVGQASGQQYQARSGRVIKEKRPREAPGWSNQRKDPSPTASPRTPHSSRDLVQRAKKQQRTGSQSDIGAQRCRQRNGNHDGTWPQKSRQRTGSQDVTGPQKSKPYTSGNVTGPSKSNRASSQHNTGAQKPRARSTSQSGMELRWAAGDATIAIRDNGALASYDSNGGLDAYWQTVVCSNHVMQSGCHDATFTVVRGGRTLNVGVVRNSFDPKKPTTPSGNASDTLAGWGFDSKSGGLSHVLQKGRQLKKGDLVRLTLSISEGKQTSAPLFRGDKGKARLSIEINGVSLGQLASGIDTGQYDDDLDDDGGGISAGAGLCWMAELCRGEAIRLG